MCRSASHRRPATRSRAEDPTLRAGDADRDRVIEALRAHAAAGRLGFDELASRVEAASAARTFGELRAVVADLPRIRLASDRRAAQARAAAELRDHLRWYVAVNLALIAVWAVTGAGHPWFVWPLLGWGIGIIAHAAPVLGARGRPRPPLRA